MQARGAVHFELVTKQRYAFGPVDPHALAEGRGLFHEAAAQLNAHLLGRAFLLGSGLSYADFRMASFLPFNDAAGLPLVDYPEVVRCYREIEQIPAWNALLARLHAPVLSPIPGYS